MDLAGLNGGSYSVAFFQWSHVVTLLGIKRNTSELWITHILGRSACLRQRRSRLAFKSDWPPIKNASDGLWEPCLTPPYVKILAGCPHRVGSLTGLPGKVASRGFCRWLSKKISKKGFLSQIITDCRRLYTMRYIFLTSPTRQAAHLVYNLTRGAYWSWV